jgi:serine O-acetyltransferase
VIVFRFGQWLLDRHIMMRIFLDPLYVILNSLIQTMWGIELPRTAKIGPGLYIGHFGGITISGKAAIGSNCNISQNVTIGVGGSGEKRGVPTIGNDVRIAPGARLFGKITIGNGARIGANAVIYKDIPDNAIAVLDPGFKIISYGGPSARDEHRA